MEKDMLKYKRYSRRKPFGVNSRQQADFEGWFLFGFILIFERQLTDWVIR